MDIELHKLYFLNIFDNSKDNEKHLDMLKHTFLKDTKVPTIIFTGNHVNFKVPKKVTDRFNKKVIDNLNKKGLHIYLTEPLCCYLEDGKTHQERQNRSFYSEFSDNADLMKIRSEELDSIQQFVNTYSLTNTKVFTCDYNDKKYLTNYSFNLECKDLFLSDIKNYIRILEKEKEIVKPFWCANGRYTQHRHLVMSYLANFDGNYSWHFNHSKNPLTDQTWLKKSKISLEHQHLITEGSKILKRKDFYLDVKVDNKPCITEFDLVEIPDLELNHNHVNFINTYSNCFLGIVTESRYAQPTSNVSEKILHCIGAKTPFVLVAPYKSLEYLRSLGFKTFGDFWSEEYDNIYDPTLRLEAILDIIDYINTLDVKQLVKTYKQMSNIIQHNIEVLKKLK